MGEGSEPMDCEEAAAARTLQQKKVVITALIGTFVANYISKPCRHNSHSWDSGPVHAAERRCLSPSPTKVSINDMIVEVDFDLIA